MTFAIREDLAKSFLEAADEIAGASRREAEAEAKALRERLKKKLGRIVDDYERDLEPVVKAIALLPPRDGGKFEVKHADHRSSTVSMDVQVIYAKDGKEKHFKVDAFTTIEGRDTFSLRIEPMPPQVQEKESATFADVGRSLAYWFAIVAPERLADLRGIMIPDTSVALNHDMKASTPLRLKTPPPG